MFLRKMLFDDLQIIFSWRNHPEIRKNMYTHHEITWDEHIAWFERISADTSCRYFVYVVDEALQGVVNFTEISQTHRNAFWGFYSNPAAPKGTGIEMEYLALNMAFEEIGMHKLNCEVIAFNQAVINMHIKVGFLLEGAFRDFHFDGERYHDVVRLGMLQSEWSSYHKLGLWARIQKRREKITVVEKS